MRVVFDRSRYTQAGGVQIQSLPEVGNVLRRLVGHSGNIVLVNNYLFLTTPAAIYFLDVHQRPVRDTPNGIDPLLALSFHLVRTLTATTQQICQPTGSRYACQHPWNVMPRQHHSGFTQLTITPTRPPKLTLKYTLTGAFIPPDFLAFPHLAR